MALTTDEAELVATDLFTIRNRDRDRLNKIKMYVQGEPRLTWLPPNSPRELQALAQMSRVNMVELIVRTATQQLYVDGYASQDAAASQDVWNIWQVNRWDARQIGLHRSISTYGVGYGTALPGQPVPVLKAHSPRTMTAAYGNDTTWPLYALQEMPDGSWRLYDETSVYVLVRGDVRKIVNGRAVAFQVVSVSEHGQGVTPVVRYLADEDLDFPVRGDVEPNYALQDQINITTFSLLVAQHYGAHGQKIIIAKMIDELEKKLRTSANTTWTIKANPDDVQVVEMSQTQLEGFIESREASLRHLSAISQTPAHELLGNLANLSAATLIEARENQRQKTVERQLVIGESHEQLLGQAGALSGIPLDPLARVRWGRQFTQATVPLVTMLTEIAQKLNVPSDALLEHLPFSNADLMEIRQSMNQTAQQMPVPAVTPDEAVDAV